MSGRPFVALDRDGTIIVERNYLSDPAQVELIPGAGRALRLMADLGYRLVLVTNQSGVARGYFDLDSIDRVHARLRALLLAYGVRLDAMYFCPHMPDATCACRKPKPGLLMRAAADLDLDLGRGAVIGDNVCDVELGQALCLPTFLVRTGHGLRVATEGTARPDYIVADLSQAAAALPALPRRILAHAA